MIKKVLLLIVFCLNFSYAEDLELKKIFDEFHLKGTLVISSFNDKKVYIYNKKRAKQQYPAASTFKIPHTLIALNEKVIYNADDIIKWDGVHRSYEAWNKDQTLRSAIAVSCVWCYKKFTKQISKEKYLEYLTQFDYGNKTVGEDKSSFWLNGDLKISAMEQIEFLKNFYSYELAIPKEYIDITKDILTVEKNDSYELKAKSGWNGTIGWYVGYVVTDNNVYFFAMNGDIKKEQLGLRQEVVLRALSSKKIL